MRWVTRAGVHIDRAACAWLIRRFVDPDAEFVFVSGGLEDMPVDATPFDVAGADLSHHGDDCTFETVLRRHELDDPVLWRLAALVHEADLDDGRYDAPEAPGFDLALRALSAVAPDEQVLELTAPLFDGVHELFRRRIVEGREPS